MSLRFSQFTQSLLQQEIEEVVRCKGQSQSIMDTHNNNNNLKKSFKKYYFPLYIISD